MQLQTGPVKNILFYGTDTLSLSVLSALHRAGYSLRAVTKNASSPVYRYCSKQELPVETFTRGTVPFTSNQLCNQLGVVASFGGMIPGKVIRSTNLGFINVHPSLLPRYQGAAPLPHILLNGDQQYGVTVLEALPNSFDKGRILDQRTLPIPLTLSGADFWSSTAGHMADTVTRYLADRSATEPCTQNHTRATFAPRIPTSQLKSLARVCPQVHTSHQIFNIWRCLDLFKLRPQLSWDGKVVKVTSLAIVQDPQILAISQRKLRSGQFMLHDGTMVMRCADDTAVALHNVVLPFKEVISAGRFYKDVFLPARVQNLFTMVYEPLGGVMAEKCGTMVRHKTGSVKSENCLTEF